MSDRQAKNTLTKRQAFRLGQLTGLDAGELVERDVAEIFDKRRFELDPNLLFGRRICGRVVRRDPVTGVLHPVPFATVHVEDTDCSFYGYFPWDWPWGWFFPFNCRREEIATAVTDRCGYFCVRVPRFEIDWILEWRRKTICPDIFIRPSIRDLLEFMPEIPELRRPFPKPWPVPEPDPPPFDLLRSGAFGFRRAEELLDRATVGRLLSTTSAEGALKERGQANFLNANAFGAHNPLPPPLPEKLRDEFGAGERDALRSAAARLDVRPEIFERIDFSRWIGPFRRCWHLLVPEWTPYLDVPDITFRVTQDVNGDGVEEDIYAEGYFDVRWDAGFIPDVTLEAGPAARTGICVRPPDTTPCGDVPEIQFIGNMPLADPAAGDPYHAAGFAKRVNRPKEIGGTRPLAETPYTGTFGLFGCNRIPGAAFYRLRYAFNGGSKVPFLNISWTLYRVVGGVTQVLPVTPDANGWYPILDPAENWEDDDMLLLWPTGSSGEYVVDVELADAALNPLPNVSAEVAVRVDNSGITASFDALAWSLTNSPNPADWTPLPLTCPVVSRPAATQIFLKVRFTAAADRLRSFDLGGSGCGGGAPLFVSTTIAPNLGAPGSVSYWHTSVGDNSKTGEAVFRLPAASPDGAYGFGLTVISRAYEPTDATAVLGATDFYFDPIDRLTWSQLPVAVVTA